MSKNSKKIADKDVGAKFFKDDRDWLASSKIFKATKEMCAHLEEREKTSLPLTKGSKPKKTSGE